MRWAEALACRGDRILKVGTDREIAPLIGTRTEVLDAGQRLVLPGFVDAHVHLVWGYELGSWIDLTDRPTLQGVQRRVAEYARTHPDEKILVGHGFDYAALQAGRLPGKEALDAAVDDRPVLLSAWDGHTGFGNTRFTELALSVVAAQGADIGEVQRDPETTDPTGIFHRIFDLTPHLPEIQARRSVEGLRQTIAAASRCGITSAFDPQVNFEDLKAYVELRKAGGLTVRIRAAIYHPKGTSRDRYDDFVVARDRFQDDWYRIGGVKLYIDGVQETGTAALLEPYANDPDSSGETTYAPDELKGMVAELDRLGFQILIHACGDRGVRIALDAYEGLPESGGGTVRRHRVEHCENLAREDIPRFAQLGVIPCMVPRHASAELTGRWQEAVGLARTRTAFPWRELLQSGAELAFASDWPVADLNPLVGIQEAVTRRTPEGDPSPHRLSVAEAVDGYTRRAAHACNAESICGTLAERKYADFLVLSQDIFEIPPERICETRVSRTVVGGRVVYEDGGRLP